MKTKLAIGLFAMMFAVSGICFAGGSKAKNPVLPVDESNENCVVFIPPNIEKVCDLVDSAPNSLNSYNCEIIAACTDEQ